MKKIIKYLLGLMGYRIIKLNVADADLKIKPKQMRSAIQSLAKQYPVKTIIDVGASNGI